MGMFIVNEEIFTHAHTDHTGRNLYKISHDCTFLIELVPIYLLAKELIETFYTFQRCLPLNSNTIY